MQKGHELPAGTTVMFSSGCYSDYSVQRVARLLKPLNEAAWNEMLAAATHATSYSEHLRFHSDEAMEWLLKNGYIEDLEYVEMHLGDYGDSPKWEDA